jgi:HNH endonuclease/NUMOD4 motif
MQTQPNKKTEVREEWKPVVRVWEMRGDPCPWLPACAFDGYNETDCFDMNLWGETRPEQWLPIMQVKGTAISGLYEVSNHGRVRSRERILYSQPRNGTQRKSKVQEPEPHHYRGRLLKLKNDDGKVRVTLCLNGRSKFVFVSHLVHEAFIGSIAPGLEIDHINRNPQHNHVSNLRACTRSQNLANKGPLTLDSGYIGVHRSKDGWTTVVSFEGKIVGRKASRDVIRCAIFHDIVSQKYFNEYTKLNFPDGLPPGYTERDAFRPELPDKNSFPLKGVARAKGRFRAHVIKNGVKILSQQYGTPLEAVRARDLAVLPFAGGKIQLNISMGEHIGLYDTEEDLCSAVDAFLRGECKR